ncbi:hypothetical protein OQA88_9886 [Cercophora sp. LCS_1]
MAASLSGPCAAEGTADSSTASPVDNDALPFSTPPKRKRPIRTYGRRSAQSKEPEPPSPKRQKPEETKRSDPVPMASSPQPPKSEPPKRGSILSYFKRIPPSASAPVTPTETTAPTLTPPPSSPVPSSRERKRRRLTTRPVVVEEIGYETPCEDTGKVNDESDCKSDGGSRHTALTETESNTLNKIQHPDRHSKENTGLGEKTKRKAKRCTAEMVQTTLNLAINPGPGFTVCKECGILYNPRNEKDRKEHKKRHAAHVRKKARAASE